MKNKTTFMFFIFAIAFICSSCLMTKSLTENSTKADIIYNCEKYISAAEWFYWNGIINGATYQAYYDAFYEVKIIAEELEDDEVIFLLKDPSFIKLVDIGERLVDSKNHNSFSGFCTRLGNGLGNIGNSMMTY